MSEPGSAVADQNDIPCDHMDFTSTWAWVQQHKSQLVLVPLGLVLFGAGWQMGRVTSPYYAAHPIVFEDRSCEEQACAPSGGTVAELEALAGQGSAVAQPSPAPLPASPAPESGAVAGTVTTSSTGKFVGSINSDLFHDPSCAAATRIKESNQVWFASIDEAKAAGYSPSKCTQDKLGIQ